MKLKYMIVVFGSDEEDSYFTKSFFFNDYDDAMRQSEIADRCCYEWELYEYKPEGYRRVM